MKKKLKKGLSRVFSNKTDKTSESLNTNTIIQLDQEDSSYEKDIFPLISPSSDRKTNRDNKKLDQNKFSSSHSTEILTTIESDSQTKSDLKQPSTTSLTEVHSQNDGDYGYSYYSTEYSVGNINNYLEYKIIKTEPFNWDKPRQIGSNQLSTPPLTEGVHLQNDGSYDYTFYSTDYSVENTSNSFKYKYIETEPFDWDKPRQTKIPLRDRANKADISGEESLSLDSSAPHILSHNQVKFGEESLSSDSSNPDILSYKRVKLDGHLLDYIIEETESLGETSSHNDDC